jgi:threonine aldolase
MNAARPNFTPAARSWWHVAGENGKMSPEALAEVLARAGRGVVHHVQPGAC